MEPLIALVAVSLIARALGTRIRALRSWPTAIRIGLVAMFLMTGISHFVGMREALVAMVPPFVHYPELVVAVTGVLEIVGAIGLLWRPTAPWAAAGLGLMLIAMFPANVHLALQGTGGMDALVPRTILQLVFLGAVAVVLRDLLPRRSAQRATGRGAPAAAGR